MQLRTRTSSHLVLSLIALAIGAGCSTPAMTTDTGSDQDAHDTGAMDTATGTDATDTVPTADVTDVSDVPSVTDASDAATPVAPDHLVINEIAVQPAGAEFVEIYNPTASAVDLSNYYLSDNASYYTIAAGMPWNPPTMNPGTDFLVQFPAGTSIASHATLVIASDPTFEMVFSRCPDFIISATPVTCTGGGMARAMVAPTNGDYGNMPGQMLSNAREMVVLFRWSGLTTERLADADYVTWGAMFDNGTRIDKTAITGYLADTAPAMQNAAPVPGLNQSIERCAGGEIGERLTGGNGITGHDETSERMDMSLRVQTTPTPGVVGACP